MGSLRGFLLSIVIIKSLYVIPLFLSDPTTFPPPISPVPASSTPSVPAGSDVVEEPEGGGGSGEAGILPDGDDVVEESGVNIEAIDDEELIHAVENGVVGSDVDNVNGAVLEGAIDADTSATIDTDGTGNSDGSGGVAISDDISSSESMNMDVDCSKVSPFPSEIFSAQPDKEIVYSQYEMLPENSIFSGLGFDRYISVFGIPIVASSETSDSSLFHAVNIFAAFIDNNNDGVVDRAVSINSIIAYKTIIGFVSGPTESDVLWQSKFTEPENIEFTKQFACNIHFFEQWETDTTPDFYTAIAAKNAAALAVSSLTDSSTSESSSCSVFEDVEFDWPLWYFPFTIAYYGYLEDFDDTVIAVLKKSMVKARTQGMFHGNYPDDEEMEMADYFVWTLLTKLKALECHCSRDIIDDVWKLCTSEGLKNFDGEWYNLLDTIEGLPTVLPNGKYLTNSSEAIGEEEADSDEGGNGDEGSGDLGPSASPDADGGETAVALTTSLVSTSSPPSPVMNTIADTFVPTVAPPPPSATPVGAALDVSASPAVEPAASGDSAGVNPEEVGSELTASV